MTMRHALFLAFGALLAAAACSLDTEGTGTGNPSDTGGTGADAGGLGGSGNLGGTGGTGNTGGASCFPGPGEKLCDGKCASKQDPAYGCSGSACSPCNVPRAVAACDGDGRCAIGTCVGGYADCNAIPLDGCEADTANDPKNCGGCGNDCSAAATGEQFVCVDGNCEVSQCPLGTEDCDGNPANGCEVDLNSDTNNCGYCTNTCQLAHATAKCEAGQCVIASCDPTWYDCDGQPPNGCEKNTAIDPANCGLCNKQCPGGNATGVAVCVGGICGLQCLPPWGDCDGNLNNGCETNKNTTLAHCGTCNRPCSTSNGSASCSNGNCSISCSSGWGNCDGNARSNGCEVNLDSSTSHCGTCNNACSSANGTPSCSGGNCAISCNAGWRDCTGGVANGCETNIRNNVNNCGSCGKICDATHGTPSCSAGNCAISCSSGWGNCDGNVDNGCERSLTTVNDCGTCNTSCSNPNGSTSCSGGACVPSCSSGWRSCDGNPNNGCETDVTTLSNCGSCGNTCSSNHGTPSCNGGSCSISCDSNWENCDGNLGNGCEANTDTSVQHCGGCNQPCSSSNGTPSCSGGECSITCAAGWGDCDNNVSNGCETNLLISKDNCNTCGNKCPGGAGAVCNNGTCG